MQLDDLKAAWGAHGAMLEKSVAINERLLREVMERKARRALAPYVIGRALEVVLGAGALLVIMPVLVDHVTETRYIVAGGLLAAYTAGITAMSAYLLVHALQVDFGGPVTEMQGQIERVKFMEYKALKWAVLGGVLAWLPAALVLFEAATGVDALGRAPLPWLFANLVLGVVVLGAGLALSRKYVERPDLSPAARRLVDALSGRGLKAAAGHLAEIARFARE